MYLSKDKFFTNKDILTQNTVYSIMFQIISFNTLKMSGLKTINYPTIIKLINSLAKRYHKV